jgi:hypothetical protein
MNRPDRCGWRECKNWAADHQALLDARFAGLKAGLELTSDQDKLWRRLKLRFAMPLSCAWIK